MTVLHAVAGYLPGLQADEVEWQTLRFGSGADRVEVAVPRLSAAQLTALAARVRQASREQLQRMTVSQIIDLVDRAIARLLDAGDPVRQQLDRLLPVVSGYDADMVRLGLTGFLKTFRAPQLQRFVAEDFANPKLLDEFQPRPKGGAARAFGPGLLVHSWAGNVPALPLWSLVCGLLVKAGNIGKLPSAEPLTAGLFARLLVELHPPLADCLAVVWWKGGDAPSAEALFGAADTVLAYGGNETLEQVRRQVPVETRFLGHGHKLGFGLVGRSALDPRRGPALARLAAHDVVRYDQQGCYSPHAFYVERGGRLSPREFAQHLAGELASLQHRFPRRAPALVEAAGVAAWRQSQELRAAAGHGVELLGEPGAAWGVACLDASAGLAPTALHRHVAVVAVDALDDLLPQLRALRPFLQTVGIAAAPAELYRLAESFGQAGVTRIAAIGAMTSPEAGWHHDGRFNLLDLVRIVDIEQAAEAGAEAYAPYAP
jgi:hypothetical protein